MTDPGRKKLSIQEFFSLAQKAMNKSKRKGEVNLSTVRKYIERTIDERRVSYRLLLFLVLERS